MLNTEKIQPESNTEIQEFFLEISCYTIDIKKLSRIDTSRFQRDLEVSILNLKNDHSKNKFIRNNKFNKSWDNLQGESRELIINLLKKYCSAEYSGFILYKELSHQLKETNNTLAKAFSFASRDEARHAAFLNKALLDFNLKPSLEFIKKDKRKYIFLPFSWFLYSTYLSEKISSCYYATIFAHLKSHPEYSIYPIFDFYKLWSEDENRHGDFLGTIIKSQVETSNKFREKLICKFSLVFIFSITYFKYQDNSKFLKMLGLNDNRQYYFFIIKGVNNSIRKDLPLVLDLANNSFFKRLDICLLYIEKNQKINESKQNIFLKYIKKTPNYLMFSLHMLGLFFIKSVSTHFDSPCDIN